jgi:spoIIIJ-associated protein
VTDVTESLAEQGDRAREFVVGLMAEFGAETSVEVVEIDDETMEVQVTGRELGLLIGPKGQTLAAVQELTRTVVQRHTAGRTGRLVVDIAGYRQRRREALEQFTRQVAAEVIASGVQRAIEPMGAADRKVVHDTANDIEGVRTMSEGEEPHRRVVLLPDPAS